MIMEVEKHQHGGCDEAPAKEAIRGTAGSASVDAAGDGATPPGGYTVRQMKDGGILWRGNISEAGKAALVAQVNRLTNSVAHYNERIEHLASEIAEQVDYRDQCKSQLEQLNRDLIVLG